MNVKLKQLIEELVKKQIEILDELAINLSQAENQNLGLYISSNGGAHRLTLFNPAKLKTYFETKASGQKVSENSYENIILGMIQVSQERKCGFYYVTAVVARKGYGPLMYDLAASAAYPNWITSDRGSVSPTARNVWKYMAKNRLSDFDMEPIDADFCKFDGEESEDVLNFKFRIKNRIIPTKLLQNTKEMIENLTKLNVDERVVRSTLGNLSTAFFSSADY